MRLTPRQAETLSINAWIVISAWMQFLVTLRGNPSSLDEQLLRRGIYQVLVLEESYIAPEYVEAVTALCDRLYVPLDELNVDVNAAP